MFSVLANKYIKFEEIIKKTHKEFQILNRLQIIITGKESVIHQTLRIGKGLQKLI